MKNHQLERYIDIIENEASDLKKATLICELLLKLESSDIIKPKHLKKEAIEENIVRFYRELKMRIDAIAHFFKKSMDTYYVDDGGENSDNDDVDEAKLKTAAKRSKIHLEVLDKIEKDYQKLAKQFEVLRGAYPREEQNNLGYAKMQRRFCYINEAKIILQVTKLKQRIHLIKEKLEKDEASTNLADYHAMLNEALFELEKKESQTQNPFTKQKINWLQEYSQKLLLQTLDHKKSSSIDPIVRFNTANNELFTLSNSSSTTLSTASTVLDGFLNNTKEECAENHEPLLKKKRSLIVNTNTFFVDAGQDCVLSEEERPAKKR